jgi:thioredoxin 1
MAKPIEVNESNCESLVLKSKTPVMVDFWATWCKPCQMVAPILDELAEEYSGKITFAKIDVGQNSKIGSQYGMSLPNLIVFKNGKPAAQVIGFKPRAELKRLLDGAVG